MTFAFSKREQTLKLFNSFAAGTANRYNPFRHLPSGTLFTGPELPPNFEKEVTTKKFVAGTGFVSQVLWTRLEIGDRSTEVGLSALKLDNTGTAAAATLCAAQPIPFRHRISLWEAVRTGGFRNHPLVKDIPQQPSALQSVPGATLAELYSVYRKLKDAGYVD